MVQFHFLRAGRDIWAPGHGSCMQVVGTQYSVHILIKPPATDKLILPVGYHLQHLAISLGSAMRQQGPHRKATQNKISNGLTNSSYPIC